MPQSKKKSRMFSVVQFMNQRKILQEELVERNNSLGNKHQEKRTRDKRLSIY